MMASDDATGAPVDRLKKALSNLNDAIDGRLDKERDFADAESEVQRMNADRARLGEELDLSAYRANRLEEANREVSRRLVAAMETIRAVLDRS